jgi:hypothetical protein
MTTQPQPGQYWGVRQIPAVRIIGFDGDECVVRHRDGRLTTLAKENWQRTDSEWQHLPDCDSFDWIPPKPRTRTVVLREWLVWDLAGHEIIHWQSTKPVCWYYSRPTGETRTIEVPIDTNESK